MTQRKQQQPCSLSVFVVYMLQHISHFADIDDVIDMYLCCIELDVIGHLDGTMCHMLTCTRAPLLHASLVRGVCCVASHYLFTAQ